MKSTWPFSAVAAAFIPIMLFADTLRIGNFNLPYRFEDNDLSDIVQHVVTNDVIAYNTATTSFTSPYMEKTGIVSIRQKTTPSTTLYLPPLFENGIKFYIENGQTNCVIKRSFTDAAKALVDELPTRTNLVYAAKQLADSIMDGTITNRSITELRMLSRVYKNETLTVVPESEGSDDVIRQNFVDMREHAVFFPPCVLDSTYKQSGTNRYFFVWVGYDIPNEPDHARSIAAFPFVYADGYWSLCFE